MMAWGRLFRSEHPVAGRVVPVMHLIAFRLRQAGPLTTTMEHRSGCDHGNAPSSWLGWPGTGLGAGTGAGMPVMPGRGAQLPPARRAGR